jgi:hypothetical protein
MAGSWFVGRFQKIIREREEANAFFVSLVSFCSN